MHFFVCEKVSGILVDRFFLKTGILVYAKSICYFNDSYDIENVLYEK